MKFEEKYSLFIAKWFYIKATLQMWSLDLAVYLFNCLQLNTNILFIFDFSFSAFVSFFVFAIGWVMTTFTSLIHYIYNCANLVSFILSFRFLNSPLSISNRFSIYFFLWYPISNWPTFYLRADQLYMLHLSAVCFMHPISPDIYSFSSHINNSFHIFD